MEISECPEILREMRIHEQTVCTRLFFLCPLTRFWEHHKCWKHLSASHFGKKISTYLCQLAPTSIFQLLYHWILISFLLISEDIKLLQCTVNKLLWIHNFAVHREDSTHPSILQQPSHPPLLQQNPHIMTTMALLKSGYREKGCLY